MKKSILIALSVLTLTGCGTKETTRVYKEVVPVQSALAFSKWVKACKENHLDKGMIAGCYSLGLNIFSDDELHLRYIYKGAMGYYLYSETIPCTEETLTDKEMLVCSGELAKIVTER